MSLPYTVRRNIRDFIRVNMAQPLTAQQIMVHFRLKPDDEPDVRELMTETAILGVPQVPPEVVTSPAKLPGDLQGRLDVILAKPVLRRVPKLQQAIEILVRNAYERQPPSALSGAQRGLLAQLDHDVRPFETGASWRSSAEADWDASRDGP